MYLLVEKVNDRNQKELKLDPGKPESAMLGYKQLPVKLLLFYIHLTLKEKNANGMLRHAY